MSLTEVIKNWMLENAAVYYGYFHHQHNTPLGDYRQEVCAVPEVEEEEVLVRTLAVGICAGDAKCFAGAPYFWGEPVSVEQVYL